MTPNVCDMIRWIVGGKAAQPELATYHDYRRASRLLADSSSAVSRTM